MMGQCEVVTPGTSQIYLSFITEGGRRGCAVGYSRFGIGVSGCFGGGGLGLLELEFNEASLILLA